MGVQITVKYNGETYKSEVNEDSSVSEAEKKFFSVLETLNALELELEDGCIALFPTDAIRNSVILLHEV